MISCKVGRAGHGAATPHIDSLVGRCSLLACYGLTLAALRTSIRASLLPPDWQTLPVTRAAITLDISDAAHIHLRLTAQVALDGVAHGINLVPDARQLVFAQVADSLTRFDAELARDSRRAVSAHAVDGCESDFNPQVVWNVYACDNSQFATPESVDCLRSSTLALLEARVSLVDYVDATLAPHHTAARSLRLYGCFDLHFGTLNLVPYRNL